MNDRFPLGAWSNLGAGGQHRSAAARNFLMLPALPNPRKPKVAEFLHRMCPDPHLGAAHFPCPSDRVKVGA